MLSFVFMKKIGLESCINTIITIAMCILKWPAYLDWAGVILLLVVVLKKYRMILDFSQFFPLYLTVYENLIKI